MQRRPALFVSVAIALFLFFSVNYLSISGAGGATNGWAQNTWPASKDENTESVPDAVPGAEALGENIAGNEIPSSENPIPLIETVADDTPPSHLNEAVFQFMEDVQYAQSKLDLTSLAKYRPHNLASSGRYPTFATYLSSRNSSIHDPYFVATQQLVYRILWSPLIATTKYPFTVFVAPFIPKQQRDILAGAGANIVELPLVEWTPNQDIYARWKDLFSKLHMWNQTEYTRIAFLDSDAFPLQNIDEIFDISSPQKCIADKIEPEDVAHQKEICDYVFSGVEMMNDKQINGGVQVLSPNSAMHARLLRNMVHTDKFDSSMVEQGYLNWQFSVTGAFPTNFIPRAYNGFFPQITERFTLKVVHEKLWMSDPWGDKLFDNMWAEMLRFYDSGKFAEIRQSDGKS